MEQVDAVGLFAPAVPQDLDGHDIAGVRVLGAVNAAKRAGSNAVEKPVAAQEVAVLVPLRSFWLCQGLR